MKVQYEFQMDEIKNDNRFYYDDDNGQYIYHGDGIKITINIWNRKVIIHNKLCDIHFSINDLLAIKFIMNMVDENEKDK